MIEIRGLDKAYGKHQVLTGVTFTAENGVVTGFVGPNGAGKSTTMRMVAALEIPDAGSVFVDGRPFSQARNPGAVMGVYLGSEYLPNNMTGEKYLAYVCKVTRIPQADISRLLQTVELGGAGNKKISSYSLGMRQRLGLAAALAGDPGTLMLDEPVNGLDPMGVQWLRSVIRQQAEMGKAVLLSSHLLSELEMVADKVVMLDHGVIVQQGALSQLETSAGGRRRTLLHTSDDAKVAAVLTKKGVPVYQDGNAIVVEELPPETLAKMVVRNNLSLYRLDEKHDSLEEVFMSAAGVVQGTEGHYEQK